MKKLLVPLSFFLLNCADLSRPAKPDAPASGVILVSTSDFTTGFLGALDPLTGKVYQDLLSVYNDSVPRYDASSAATYILQRLGSDSIRRLDNSNGYLTVYEKSLGTKSNPQDLIVLPGNQIAVSYLNKNTIEILNPATAAKISEIELAAYADADGYAEIGSMTYQGGYIFATAARLNRLATDAIWPPVGQSYLLRINTSNYQVTSYLVPFANPTSRLHFSAARNSLIFAAPARFASSYALDGGCVEFSLGSATFVTSPISEAQAGYEIADCQIQADGSGIFVGYDSGLNSIFGSFDPAAHTLTRIAATLSRNVGGYFSGFLLHSNGKVYLADRNILAPGIRIFSGPTLSEQTSKAIYTGLPPYSMEEVP